METDPVLYLLFILILLVVFRRMEWNAHLRNLGAIPVRIVVNGTRGKSSVTRLIGAGLTAGGFKVMAKTTGTKPRMLFNNRVEVPVIRMGKPNIREQLAIFKRAVKERVNAVILENMSLRPDLQWTEETKICDPTLVVITNVRRDHLDVMGPGLPDIARNFINAVPEGALVITAEKDLFPLMEALCEKKGLRIIRSNGHDDKPEISEQEMRNFPYLEQKENVAFAVEVCKNLGIPRNTALEEMYKCIPDPGVLKKYDLLIGNKKITLFNALSVNDPDSIHMIYQQIGKPASNFYVLINCRADRIDRSAHIARTLCVRMRGDLYFLTGGNTAIFYHSASNCINKEKLIDLGGKGIGEAYEHIMRKIENDSTIFAVGNFVGYGEELIEYFVSRDMEKALFDANLLKHRTDYASVGGVDDTGRGLSIEGRDSIIDAISRNKLPQIEANGLNDAIRTRKDIYKVMSKGENIKAFINIGGGSAALAGVNIDSGIVDPGKLSGHPGLVGEFLRAGTTVINLENIKFLSRKYRLPFAPTPLPEMGEGKIFYEMRHSVVLASIFALILILILFVILRLDIDYYLRALIKRNG